MCAEASTVLRAVAADFFCNCWYLICWKWNQRTPELYSAGPDRPEYCFIYEKFVACREF
jgi:hypothetical protein